LNIRIKLQRGLGQKLTFFDEETEICQTASIFVYKKWESFCNKLLKDQKNCDKLEASRREKVFGRHEAPYIRSEILREKTF